MTLKTREEIVADFETEFLSLLSMNIRVEGFDKVLVFSRDMDPIPQNLHIALPENCNYYLSIKYRVKKKTLHKLRYYQVVKKYGIPFRTRDLEVKEEVPESPDDDSYYEVTFPADTLPGGALIRGSYPATSKFYADGVEIFNYDWTVEIVKKNREPEILGV